MDGKTAGAETARIAAEKKALKKECTLFGLLTVGPQLLLTVAVCAVAVGCVLMRVSPNALLETLELLETQIVTSVLVFFVPFLIATRISRRSFHGIFPIRRVRASLLIPLLGASLSGLMLLNLLLVPYEWVLERIGLETAYAELQRPEGVGGTLLYVVTIAVVPALVEEFAFRGVVLGHLRRYGNTFAILASSLLFGLMHGNAVQIPFAFAAGCIMAYADVLAGSLLPSLILHFLNNLVSALGSIVWACGSEAAGMWFSMGSLFVCFVIGVFCVWRLAGRYPYAFRSAGCGVLSTRSAMRAFVGTAGFWVPLVYFGGEALVLAFGS